MKILEPIEKAHGFPVVCPTCTRPLTVDSLSVASYITNHGCQECRDKEFEKGGEEMPRAIAKGSSKQTVREIIKNNPQLVEGNGKVPGESAAVRRAKDKKIEIQPKFDELKDPVQKPNPLIEEMAIHKKKISKEKVALMAEETKLDAGIRELMKADGLTHYKNDNIDVELVSTKDKLVIKILDDEEEE